MFTARSLLLALFVQSSGSASAAAAVPEAQVTRARLSVRGPADCLSRADLATRITARSKRIQLADDAGISADISLALSRPGNVVADLVLAAGGEPQSPRRIVARSCAEAADAIALIIAVTLDPTARRKPPAEVEADSRVTAKPPEATVVTAKTPEPTVVSPPTPPATPPPVAEPPSPTVTAEAPAPPQSAPSGRTPRQFGVFVAGQTIFGPAPSVMPGIALHGMAALERDGLWSPALVVGVTHVWREGIAETGGDASFTLDAASVDACPVRVRLSWLAARPCASALVGRIVASGSSTENAASAARPFAVAGAAVTATVGSTVVLFLRLGLGVTISRDAYEFGADVFYRSGRVTTSASVGIGLRWP